jgi:hypothetical protein
LKSPLLELIGVRGVKILGAVLAVAGAGLVVFRRRWTVRAAAAVLTIFFPFCAVTFGQALWRAARAPNRDFPVHAPAPMLPPMPGAPRVLWVLFDEWDYRLTFTEPDPTLRLPQLARLRGEALFATEARPPGPETPISIPAYFSGRVVTGIRYEGPNDLLLFLPRAAEPVPWSRQPSIFASARALGFNTAVVGWFHPTCRVLESLTSCRWWTMPQQFNSMGTTFGELMLNQTRSLFQTTLFALWGQSLPVQRQVETYHEIFQAGMAVANNPEYGLSFVHMPVPHAPHAYDRRTGQFTLRNSPIRGYFDSLALVDRTVGELRRSMEAAGTWDQTTILFTSDHPYRESEILDGKSDPRIPYILKFAGHSQAAVYDRPFHGVLTHDLLLAVLRGEIRDPGDAARWLDENRLRVPVP